jgi:hypothetical protein
MGTDYIGSGGEFVSIRKEENIFDLLIVLCFNATFSNISAISWRPVLVVEEAGENHRP